jgi:hypothetical protein
MGGTAELKLEAFVEIWLQVFQVESNGRKKSVVASSRQKELILK